MLNLTMSTATLTLLLAALAALFTSALLLALLRAETRSRADDAAWSDSRACIASMFLLPSQRAPQPASDAPTWGVVE